MDWPLSWSGDDDGRQPPSASHVGLVEDHVSLDQVGRQESARERICNIFHE